MTIWFANGTKGTVEDISNEGLEEPVTVYNFEVTDFHTYFVGECGVLVHNTCAVMDDGTEVYYRAMSEDDYDYLRMTGEVRATGETFISPTESFSSDYDGVLVRFETKPGTTNELLNVAVSNNSEQSIYDYGVLPQVEKGWGENNAFFKGEGTQTNIGLGKGKGLEIFNSNILNFSAIGGK